MEGLIVAWGMGFWIGILLQALVFAFASQYLARSKGKDPNTWFWLGFFFGFIAFLVIAFVPPEPGASTASMPQGVTVSASTLHKPVVSTGGNPPRLIDLYSPVEITDVPLAVDSQTGRVLIRPVMTNVSNQVVSALRLQITCYDSFGDKVASPHNPMLVNVQDENAAPMSEIAAGKVMDLSVLSDTRIVDVLVIRVAFADGSFWEKGDYPFVTPYKQVKPEGRALRDLTNSAGKGAVGYSHIADSYWVCVCGRHNSLSETHCLRCDREKVVVLEQYANAESVLSALDEIGAKKKAHEERQVQLAAEEARKSRERSLKAAKVVVPMLVLAVALFFAATKWYIPSQAYSVAVKLLDSGDYDGARNAFTELGTFRNSAEMLSEVVFRQAKDSAKQMEIAQDALKEQTYLLAVGHHQSGDFLSAVTNIKKVSGYKDSNELIKQYLYDWAKHLASRGNYSSAINKLRGIGSSPPYRDTALLIEQYTNAFTEDEYVEAVRRYNLGYLPIKEFQDLGDYKQSETYLANLKALLSRFQGTWHREGGSFYKYVPFDGGEMRCTGSDNVSAWEMRAIVRIEKITSSKFKLSNNYAETFEIEFTSATQFRISDLGSKSNSGTYGRISTTVKRR